MKTIIRLAVLALAGTSALALAGNALATQKLSVKQSTTSLTIKVSQAQSDAQPARISIYVPSGYTINASAAPGTRIGSTSGTVFSRDANIPLPLSGDVVVVPPTTNAPGCDPVPHIAVWNLALVGCGAERSTCRSTSTSCQAPRRHLARTSSSSASRPTTSRSARRAARRTAPACSTPRSRWTTSSPCPPARASGRRSRRRTPPASGAPNAAGTVETRAFVANGAITLARRSTQRSDS